MTVSLQPVDPTQAALTETIQRLRSLSQCDLQAQWRMTLMDLPIDEGTNAVLWADWAIAPLNGRHHIAWGKGRKGLWLGLRFRVPADCAGYPVAGLVLRVALSWWAESAQIFVNGQLVQEGDLFDCATRIVLTHSAQPGECFDIAVRLVSPGHDDGALVRSLAIYDVADLDAAISPEPGYVADELAVLQTYCTAFAPERLGILTDAIEQIDWSQVGDRATFDRTLAALRQTLQPLSSWIKQRTIHLLGHAHLDLAWLWPIPDTWDAAERTFTSVLNLQRHFPELIFGHSTPMLYEWIEQNRPDLFADIQRQVQAGRWEIIAGLWVEPELNTLGVESLVRQVLYGQRYIQQRFPTCGLCKIAWLPDSFGFSWQLPQILQQGGIEYFVTQKLRWNDTTQFPYDWFEWRSPDGTGIRSFMSPPIGESIDPIKMTTYAAQWETQTTHQSAFWLPGVGDHGGGPTRDMLEVAQRWQRSPFFPTLQFSTALEYLDRLTEQSDSPLPIWSDELYLEFHRGCYTTHADQKRWNRRSEQRLYQAELFAAIATLLTQQPYPQALIETAWKNVLFNQFHDILPGSSIREVFEEANQGWEAAAQIGQQVLDQALQAIAQQITLPAPPDPASLPLVVFNPLNWDRSEVVAIACPSDPEMAAWQVQDAAGQVIPSQIQRSSDGSAHLLAWLDRVPGVGYTTLWLTPQSNPQPEPLPDPPSDFVLENRFLRVEIEPATGEIRRIWDQQNQRDVLNGTGNQLLAFQDQGQYWDAWNIDPQYAEHPLPPPQLVSMQWTEWGTVRSRLRVIRQLGQSTICQEYGLDRESSVLTIETTVDWQESGVLLKAAFPLTVTAAHATYEIPGAAIQRPTDPTDPHNKAKWEVPALQWADLGDGEYGVSLLNDCKYGYDATPSQLRLTLLRSPNWPEPNADRGLHHFTYALYPHAGSWQAAKTVHQASNLNQPLRVVGINGRSPYPTLPTTGYLLRLPQPNLVLTAFKRSEEKDAWVLRCYEAHGEPTDLRIGANPEQPHTLTVVGLENAIAHLSNLLELPLEASDQAREWAIAPWRIVTMLLD